MHYGNYTDTANDWVNKTLAGVSTGLSMVGVSIIILTYLFIKEIRTLSRHIIVCISVADLVTCLSNVSGLLITPDATVSSLECKVQSFVGTTAVLSSFLWTMMLAVYLYVIIVKQMHSLGRRIIIPYSHVLCWCLPLAINIIAISFGALGNDEDNTSSGWCWISLYKDKSTKRPREFVIAWMLIDGKFIEILTYFVIACLYILIKIHLRTKIQKFRRSESPYGTFLTKRTCDAARQTDKKLIFIPVIVILLRIWGTIRFFLFVFNVKGVKQFQEVLIRMHVIGDNLIGFMNCLMFCFFTPKVFQNMRLCCFKCYKKFCKRRESFQDYYYDGDLSSSSGSDIESD